MNEDYIAKVRRSLYKNDNLNKKKPKKFGKIIYGLEMYKSENVFSNLPDDKSKTKKTQKRDNSFSDDSFEDKSKYEEHFKRRKKKLNTGTTRPGFNIHDKFSPSTTEHSDLNSSQKQHFSNKKLWRLSTDDFEEDFNLNEFFNTKEPSFNESFTESHHGIDYEFLSNRIGNVHITSSKISNVKSRSMNNTKNKTLRTIEKTSGDDNNEVVSIESEEETVSNLHENHSIPLVELTSSEEYIFLSDETQANANEQDYNNDVILNQSEAEILESTPSENSSINQLQNSSIPVVEVTSSEEIVFLNDETQENVTINPESFHKRNSCKYFDLGSQKLVILKENSLVPFFGLCSLKVLHGKIEILGCILTKRSKEINAYSPRGSSLLVVKNVTGNDEENDFEELQPILNSNESLKRLTLSNTSAVFICSKVNEFKIAFIEKYISQQIFPKIDVYRAPQIIFDPKDKFNTISTDPKWDDVLNSVNTSTRLLIAGGKGVGKSTFLRYSINKLLNRFERVRVIDLDPGQSEFSVPGCISVVTLSDPVLGPNYTHLQRTERSYLSDINVGHNPKKYIQLIKFLTDSLSSLEDLPTLINCMGFATGIGINIISSAITYLKPTDVIQIDSKNHKKNFKTDLTVTNVNEICRLFGKNPGDVFNFNLKKFFTSTDNNTGWSMEARQIREMCVLAYFGEMMKSGVESLTNHNLPMYTIDLKSMQITDTEGKTLPPAAINGLMVALCSRSENPEIFSILGYGLVRGIDLEAKQLVLITPEPIDVLENVFYLVLTSVSLPPSVYMTPDDVIGPIPYVMEGELEGLGQITKRSYIPANKK